MTKNIIVIGRTGSGKSTLANVLTNTSIFKEGSYGSSETENCQVGKVLSEIEKVIKSVKELSKVLLVVDNNSFTEGEKEIFKLLESVLGNEIDKYTTIVRTNFVNFEDENSCAEDSKFLIEEITKFSISFTSCKVIHMDNPSINISESSKNAEKLINLNKQTREESRKKLLENLKEERCQIAMEENERFETIESPTEEIGKGKLKCQIL
ncbi:8975_t:CDS:2 [Paraglomus occultum]|uniref:8975_t:CDS:1 n=1 Tax=Paraglomus occultum TaxID=144539 RepID=A0A9N9C2I8_9GLOM|nr:8975_t:CDS:2 [Paraglomus occultum]